MTGFDAGPECHAEADKRASQQLPVMHDSNLADCGSIPHISTGVDSERRGRNHGNRTHEWKQLHR